MTDFSPEDQVAFHRITSECTDGIVALVALGDTVDVEVHGTMSAGGEPMRRDALFRIASTTKPITAVATLVLDSEGLLSLDESVDRLLPELANRRVLRRIDGRLSDSVSAHRAITIRDLCTFTFGFGMDMDMFTAAEPWPIVEAASDLCTLGPPDPSAMPDPDAWIELLGKLPLLAQPGERWFYNTGAQVLGVLLSRAAGMSFGEVLRTRIFEPLGMVDTSFWTSDTTRIPTSYGSLSNGNAVFDPPDGAWSRPPRFEDGAAGLLSTADDLLCFARMFLRGGSPILDASRITEMTTDQLTTGQRARDGLTILMGQGWGLGVAVSTEGPRAGSFGWDGGLGTSWFVDPAKDLVVIVLTQRMFDSPTLPAVHVALRDAAYALLG